MALEMETATAQEMGAFNAQRGSMMDRSAYVARFYRTAVLDERATNGWDEELFHPTTGVPYRKRHPGAGREIYRDVDFIELRRPGDTLEIRVREVRTSDKQSFPRQWQAYQNGMSEKVQGTPISVLPGISKSHEMELRYLGIGTIENLRDVSDADGQNIQGFNALKKRATDFLSAAEGDAPNQRLRTELEQRDAEIATLKAQVAAIAEAQNKQVAKKG